MLQTHEPAQKRLVEDGEIRHVEAGLPAAQARSYASGLARMSRDDAQVLTGVPEIDGTVVGFQAVQKPPVVRCGVGGGQNREAGFRRRPRAFWKDTAPRDASCQNPLRSDRLRPCISGTITPSRDTEMLRASAGMFSADRMRVRRSDGSTSKSAFVGRFTAAACSPRGDTQLVLARISQASRVGQWLAIGRIRWRLENMRE